MKKYLLLLMLVFACFVVTSCCDNVSDSLETGKLDTNLIEGKEYTENIDGVEWKYIRRGNGVEIIETIVVGDIKIPSELGGLPVKTIGDEAFKDCRSLTSIEIPSSVTEIGHEAFMWCSSLTSIVIPDSVTTIGDWAFFECESLTSIKIPSSVRSIGIGAFKDCDDSIYDTTTKPGFKLVDGWVVDCDSDYHMPLNLNGIRGIANCALSGLSYIDVSDDDPKYASQDGVLYSKDMKKLICCSRAKTSCYIPSSVTEIGDSAFEDCSRLTSLDIPSSVTTIGDGAFSWCWRLTSLDIPSSVTTIGNSAFEGCESLTSLHIPSSVTTIGDGAFSGCDRLTSLDIPRKFEKDRERLGIDNDVEIIPID